MYPWRMCLWTGGSMACQFHIRKWSKMLPSFRTSPKNQLTVNIFLTNSTHQIRPLHWITIINRTYVYVFLFMHRFLVRREHTCPTFSSLNSVWKLRSWEIIDDGNYKGLSTDTKQIRWHEQSLGHIAGKLIVFVIVQLNRPGRRWSSR